MPRPRPAADRATAEDILYRMAAAGADLDAVATRTVRAAEQVEALGGSPNQLLALRRAAEAAAAAAHELRREGLLNDYQQKLL